MKPRDDVDVDQYETTMWSTRMCRMVFVFSSPQKTAPKDGNAPKMSIYGPNLVPILHNTRRAWLVFPIVTGAVDVGGSAVGLPDCDGI